MATVHYKWNDNTAILSGDTMFVLAYEYVAKTDASLLPEVLFLFNDTARKVCEVQQYDMDFETLTDVSIGQYMMMIRLKTAVLIACSLKLGAVIAGADPLEANIIYDFGIELGLAFQLQDDYLDAFGDTKVFGKAIGGDILTNKKTFLYLKAFETARGDDLIRLKYLYTTPGIPVDEKTTRVIELYRKLGIDEFTRKEINQHHSRASFLFEELNIPDDRKKQLRTLARRMVGRKK
jgi:geranylgeranyl diphosphate synthase type II